MARFFLGLIFVIVFGRFITDGMGYLGLSILDKKEHLEFLTPNF